MDAPRRQWYSSSLSSLLRPSNTDTAMMPPSKPFPSSFPPEIIYCILEERTLDISTLQACSLVSRSWSSIARRSLFKWVTIRNDEPERDIHSFTRFIHSDASLPSIIKDLTFTRGDTSVDEILQVVAQLPRLTELAIEDMAITPSSPDRSSTPPSSLPHCLMCLCVTECLIEHTVPPWAALFELITAFPAVDDLILSDLCTGPTDPYVNLLAFPLSPMPCSFTFPSHKTVAKNLIISPESGPYVEGLSLGLLSSLDMDEVEALELDVWEGEGVELSQTLVEAAQGAVSLRLCLDQWLKDAPPLFSLASCHFLGSVTFFIRLSEPKLKTNKKLLQNDIACSLETLSTIPLFDEEDQYSSSSTKDGSEELISGLPLTRVNFELSLTNDVFKSDYNLKAIVKCINWSQLSIALKRFPKLKELGLIFFVPKRPGSDRSGMLEDYLKCQLNRVGLAGKYNIRIYCW